MFCLKNNISNKFIKNIFIFNEGFENDLLIHPKIFIIEIKNRSTYKDIIGYFIPDEVNIIANSDVWFDNTLYYIPFLMLRKSDVLCLTRHEKNGTLYRENYGDSQDAWVVVGRPTILGLDFFMGKPGCDNRLAFEFFKNGYRVLNPSKCICIYHEHRSNIRSYTQEERVLTPYLKLKPLGFFNFHFHRLLLWYIKRKKVIQFDF